MAHARGADLRGYTLNWLEPPNVTLCCPGIAADGRAEFGGAGLITYLEGYSSRLAARSPHLCPEFHHIR
jgi:hypothetical protein